MSVDSYTLTLPASGVAKMPNPANFFFLLSSTNPIAIQFTGGITQKGSAANETFNGLSAGLRIQRLNSWANANFIGAAGTVLTFFYGTETPREDSTDYVQTIATISGTVLISPGTGSPNAPTDHADVTVAATTIDTSVGVNAARKSVSIGSFSSNAPASLNLRVIAHGSGVGKGVELQPGQFINIATQAALDVNNPDANSQKYWWQEYT
jgi:hypothetical protein